jgi:non-heme chloroperoxidase
MPWIRGLIFTVLVPGTIALYVPFSMAERLAPRGGFWNAGWLLDGIGAFGYLWCFVGFLTSGGTPAIFFTRPVRFLIGEEPTRLVQGGLYRISRNPMYLSVLLVIFGQALRFASWPIAEYGLFVWLGFHLVVIALEEPHLRDERGSSYQEYCRRVPRWIGPLATVVMWLPIGVSPACAQLPPTKISWHDPSPHTTQFVQVEEGVRLEVLDWGGAGTPVVLLAGSGLSAHGFDEFAPKLVPFSRVYGVTRRGFGASSQPGNGYDDQRLADDVLAVIDALRIPAPVLIGHSMAGQEMTTLGRQHSDRLAGLVYVDAHGDPGDDPNSDPAWVELQKKLPEGFRDPGRPPFTGETRTFAGYRAFLSQTRGLTLPESEFRNTYETNSDGTIGRYKSPDIPSRIGHLQIPKNFAGIRVPVLALFEFPRTIDEYPRPGEYVPANPQERAAIAAFMLATKTIADRWSAKLVTAVPDATLIDLPGAGHFVYITREAEVIQHIQEFLATLVRR